jgi:hypothetical protein
LLVLVVLFMVAFACGMQILIHSHFKDEDFVEHNEVAGFIIAVVGTLYAVVLGFITVVTWQGYNDTRERVALEASSVTDAWHAAVGLPPPVRKTLRKDMLMYATEMANVEWRKMREGSFSPVGDELIMDATNIVGTAPIADRSAQNAQAETLRLLSELHDSRSRRLEANFDGLSWLEWTVLAIGAITVLALCWLFGVRRSAAHLIMTGSVAVIVATLFVLVFELQAPFRSDVGISNGAWTAVLAHIELMDRADSAMPGMRM